MLIEFDGRGRPIVVDRPMYRELVKRTHDDLETKAAAAAKEKKAARAGKRPCLAKAHAGVRLQARPTEGRTC